MVVHPLTDTHRHGHMTIRRGHMTGHRQPKDETAHIAQINKQKLHKHTYTRTLYTCTHIIYMYLTVTQRMLPHVCIIYIATRTSTHNMITIFSRNIEHTVTCIYMYMHVHCIHKSWNVHKHIKLHLYMYMYMYIHNAHEYRERLTDI